MRVTITWQMWEQVQQNAALKNTLANAFNASNDDWQYRKRPTEIDIAGKSAKVLQTLEDGFAVMKGIRGHMDAVRTIRAWRGSGDTSGATKADTTEQWAMLLMSYFAVQPHQRVYMQDDDYWDAQQGTWRAYHLASVEFTKEKRITETEEDEDGHERKYKHIVPATVTLTFAYKVWGNVKTKSRTLQNLKGMTVGEGLRGAGIYPETPDLREAYLEENARFVKLGGKIGQQCLARGQATDDCDGNPGHKNYWWWSRNVVTLDPLGEPSRVVVDVLAEGENEDERDSYYGRHHRNRDHNDHIDLDFWKKKRNAIAGAEEKYAKALADYEATAARTEHAAAEADDLIDEDSDDESSDEGDKPLHPILVTEEDTEDENPEEDKGVEIPVYPMLVVFDMKRHLRLRVHISQLEEYIYNMRLGERLILPNDVRGLVRVLLSQKSGFQDAITGKGGGVIVLCAGAPGTGKTLTAEIYSEVNQRPLYAVQTAQLGTTPEAVENELRRIFARSSRWGAILLLDEADVYVRARGDDMKQNAIVGVFLRVLEYYQGILFLTTNRVDSVDDAIASRCVARIDYRTPHPNDQKKIWRMLADLNNVKITDATIDAAVEKHNDCSGRDIKNLLKLAMLVKNNAEIDLDTIDMVKRFKPTKSSSEIADQDVQEGGAFVIPQGARAARKLD